MEPFENLTLKEMKFKKDLNLEMIYKAINKYTDSELKPNLEIKINDYKIVISTIAGYSLFFNFENKIYMIYRNPFKFKIRLNNNNLVDLDIVCLNQIGIIKKKYHFNQLVITCPEKEKKSFIIDYTNLRNHSNHKEDFIQEYLPIITISKLEFKDFFKERFDFLGKTLEPEIFEPNFKLYFKNSELILEKNKITIFQDKYQERINIISKISDHDSPGAVKKIFGQPGKGKTLGLIGAMKYMVNHKDTGTLYNNCKALSDSSNAIEVKQLFIDEIPYLFYEDYKGYNDCVKTILNYDYDVNNSTFFDILNLIVDQIIKMKNKKKSYIIVLDQYNDKIDKGCKELDKLESKLMKNKCEEIKDITFNLVTFSSMNNKDIREYKVKHIINNLYQQNTIGHLLVEINNLEYDLSIDKGGIYDKNLRRLGNGLKYYNILYNYYVKKTEFEMIQFVSTTKEHIKYNIRDFYKINKDKYEASDCQLLGKFSAGVPYSSEELKKIMYNIPFKYFDVIKDEKKQEYIITFSFPLVEEVLDEIYSDIINKNPQIYNNLTKFQLDGGAKGKFFEKIITYYLNITSSIYKEKEKIEYFEDYPITYHEEINALVLNNNESIDKIEFEKKLERGIYLITQKRYNGKALDIALLKIGDVNEIIGIQISIYKKDIFTKEQVSEFLSNLQQVIKKYFDLEVDDKNLFFSYIFEWDNVNKYIIDKCDRNGLKYFYFQVNEKIFRDARGNIITKLKPNLINPPPYHKHKNNYSIEQYFKIKTKDNSKETQYLSYEISIGPFIKINENQKITIIKIFKKHLKYKKSVEIKYQKSLNFFTSSLVEKINEFCVWDYIGDDQIYYNSILMYNKNTNFLIIKENGQAFLSNFKHSSKYDYYIVEEN